MDGVYNPTHMLFSYDIPIPSSEPLCARLSAQLTGTTTHTSTILTVQNSSGSSSSGNVKELVMYMKDKIDLQDLEHDDTDKVKKDEKIYIII